MCKTLEHGGLKSDAKNGDSTEAEFEGGPGLPEHERLNHARKREATIVKARSGPGLRSLGTLAVPRPNPLKDLAETMLKCGLEQQNTEHCYRIFRFRMIMEESPLKESRQ
jgi:hypothetical protein